MLYMYPSCRSWPYNYIEPQCNTTINPPTPKNPQLYAAKPDKKGIQSVAFYPTGRTFTPLTPTLSFCCYQQKQSGLAAAMSASSGSPHVVPLSHFQQRPVPLPPRTRPRPLLVCRIFPSRDRSDPLSERLSSESIPHGKCVASIKTARLSRRYAEKEIMRRFLDCGGETSGLG